MQPSGCKLWHSQWVYTHMHVCNCVGTTLNVLHPLLGSELRDPIIVLKTPMNMRLRFSFINVKVGPVYCAWSSRRPFMVWTAFVSHKTAVYLFSCRRLISNITTSIQSITVVTKGLFYSAACLHVFVFFNGPQNAELHEHLIETGCKSSAITRTKQSTTALHRGTSQLSKLSLVGSAKLLVPEFSEPQLVAIPIADSGN